MALNPWLSPRLVVTLVLSCLLIHGGLLDKPRSMPQPSRASNKRQRKRAQKPTPFPGLIRTPLCEACAQGPVPAPKRRAHPSLHPLRSRLASPIKSGAGAKDCCAV